MRFGNKGFTLVELIIALLLILILATGLNMFLTLYLKKIKLYKEKMELLPKINGALEYLKNLEFNNSTCLNPGTHNCTLSCCGFELENVIYTVEKHNSLELKKISIKDTKFDISFTVYKRKE